MRMALVDDAAATWEPIDSLVMWDRNPRNNDGLLGELVASVRGEVYQLGLHRVLCGDSTSAEDVAILTGGAMGSDGAVWWFYPW